MDRNSKVNLRVVCSLLFCFLCLWTVSAQPTFLKTDSIVRHTTIFHANVGYGYAVNAGGTSAWQGVDDHNTGWLYNLRWSCFSNTSSWGYGGYLFGFTDKDDCSFAVSEKTDERMQLCYVAPQFSYIKKGTDFSDRLFSVVDFGVGYLRYDSRTDFPGNEYHAKYNGVGVNLDVALEYAFNAHWGAKLEAGGLFSPIRLNGEGRPDIGWQLRSNVNLLMLTLGIGISCYL